MFRSKRDVDRHVQEILRKLSSEKERNLRCYNIAKLYYQVGDYESARRYISSYLTVREDSASGHKLFAQVLEALGQKEKAITEYKCSLELENSQPDIILKVCDLLGDSDLSIDLGRVRYWCERASQLYPHHPAVFKLKERLLSTKGEESLHELEALISSEMSARPSDVSLRIRLIKLYQEADRLKDAYDHIIEVERRSLFRENLDWYECISVVLKAYGEKFSDICGWEFYLYYTSVQEKKAYLSLCENHATLHKTVADCVQVLFSFDQLLTKTSQQSPPPSERDYCQEFLRHMRGQLCFHLATLILKRAKKQDQTNWREMCRMAIPLLLHALGPPPDVSNVGTVKASESRRKIVLQWSKEAAFRISQAGHVLLAMLHERRSQFLDRITQYCSGNWRERVFQRIFNTRDHHQQIGSSHFVNFAGFADPPLEIPTASELRPHDELSQQLYPNSLHHLVWLGLQKLSANKSSTSSKLCKDFYCLVFDGLQLTTKNLNSAGIETLCRLDIDAFLYATVLCVAAAQEEQLAVGYSNSDRPATLPACITDQLCTVAQDKWWMAAYTVVQKQVEGNLGELRQVLQHGIEVVRILGNHGLDVRLIVQLARAFAERATSMTARGESAADVTAIEQRAALYWTSALPLLERLQRNQAIRAPHTKLFEYHGKELSSAEINTLIEEGRFFLACQLMKEEKHERALEAFEQLKSPYAAFYRALIYKKLAEEQFQGQHREMITSEMRSQHIILLTKARECFYLTLDRLKSPGVDSKHPLNAELGGHIEEIESQLHHIDTDVSRSDVNRNDMLDGLSLETASSEHSPVDNGHMFIGYNGTVQNSYAHISTRNRSANRLSSTPYRSNNKCDTSDAQEIRRVEARPSPERLDAQIRQLLHNRDSVLQTVTQHSKAVMDSIKVIMEELKDCKKEMKESKEELKGYNQELRHNKQMIEELKAQVQELRKETLKLKKGQSRVNSELSQVCDTEDDLYVFDEDDYAEDVTIAASHMGTYPPFQPFPGYPDYRPVSGIMGTSSVPYAPPPPPPREAHPPLIPPTQPMGGFFRGVEPALIYPPGTVGYYSGQGALPFSEGQQLPDFRGHQAPAFSRLGAHPDPQNSQPEVKVSLSSAPVNVVITSSDTLPTTVPVTQPILSVTIPPQHRLGGIPLVQSDLGTSMPQAVVSTTYSASKPLPLTTPQSSFSTTSHLQQQLPQSQAAVSNCGQHTVPHAFQISMPPQAHLPQVSSLEKGAASLSPVLPIATNSLLSSVPSPVYSAVVTEKNAVTKETTPKSRQASMGSNAEEDNVAETDHDPCPDFEPVIPLPAEVQVMTGEEEETVLFESRAKLYRFVEKEWKERGIGNIKLLHNQKTGKIRILMRREQVLKVCANHFITADTELVPMKDRAWIWVANDFADEQVKLEKLCVRFKTPEEASNFKDAFEKAKTIIRSAQMSMEDDSTVSSRSASSTKTVDSVASSQDSSSSVLKKEIASETSLPSSSTAPSSVSVASSKITVGGFTFASTPTFKINTTPTVKTVESDSSKAKVTQDDTPKASPFATFSFAMPSKPVSFSEVSKPVVAVVDPFKATSTPDTSTPVKVVTQKQDSKADTTVSVSSKVTVSKPDVTDLPTQSQQIGTSQEVTQFSSQRNMTAVEAEKTANERLMFSSNSLTFADLAAKSPAGKPAFAADSNFKGFEGAGSVVFGSTQISQKPKPQITQSSPECVSERPPEEFVPTAEFKPVIPLPELVEVRTGEEEEEILFEERCKLLRFDGENKEWKERGLGKMKLLHDPKTGRVRLLMRREQVLKVCCNHAITKTMKFKPLSTSDRAWHWAAQDYSEGEMRPELFALKFKTTDLAEKFKKAVEDTQAKMINDRIPLDGGIKKELSAETNNEKQMKETLKTGEKTSSTPNIWECPSCRKNNPPDSSSCHSCSSNKIQKTSDEHSNTSQKSLSEFKPKAGSWECRSCYTRNEATCRTCVACEAPRTLTTAQSTSSTTSDLESKPLSQNIVPLSEAFKPKAGSWTCSDCYLTNDEKSNRCVACDKPRLGSDGKPINESIAEDKTAFKFGIQSSSTTENSSGFNLSRFLPTCDSVTGTTTTTTDMSTASCAFSFGFPKISSQNKDGAASFSFGSSVGPQNTLDTAGTPLKSDLAVESENVPKQSFSFGFQGPTNSVETPQVKQLSKTKSTPTFVFGNLLPAAKSTGAAVTFGADETPQTPKKENTLAQVRSEHSFTFGSPGKFEFSFSGVRPKSPVKSPKSPGTKHSVSVGEEESGSEEEEDEGDNIYFQPVIPLPDKVPVHTGEEEEDLMYCQHAKLYRFVSGEWKERGVGDIKILRHRVTKKIRLLMRRDQVLKVCLNHFLTPEITFIQKDAKSWLWSAPDFSDGHIQNERFAIRFKTSDFAADFKKAIESSLADVGEGKSSTPEKESNKNAEMADTKLSLEIKSDGSGAVQPLFGGSSKVSQEKIDDSPEVIYELAVTEQEKAEAKRLMLPSNFYAYRRKPGCPGCPGCKDDRVSESDEERVPESSDAVTSALKPTGSGDFSFGALGPKTAGTIGDHIEDKNNRVASTAPAKPKIGSGILQPPTFSFTPTFSQPTATTSTPWFSQNTAAVFTSPAKAAGDSKNVTDIDTTTSLHNENKFGVVSFVTTNTVTEKAALSTPEFGKTPGLSFESEEQINNLAAGDSLFGSQGQKVESCSDAPLFTLFPPSSQTKTVQDPPLIFNFGPSSKLGCEPKVSKTPGFGFTAPFQTQSILRTSATENKDLKTTMEPSNSILQPDEKQKTGGNKLEENSKPEAPFSSVPPTISFADLASKMKPQDPQPGTDSTFKWEGAGSFVFGGLKKETPQKLEASYQQKSEPPDSAAEEEASDEETAASSGHDPHFEPVIPLPDTIVVHTGEEEEVVKFVSRATLYRFDEATKQWKERGVGDMKILYHPINHTYRLLLRREKIHKVVCNHLITADFSLKPFSKSERAWLWAALNFAENEGELEKLAVCFKKEETAKEFYDKVSESVEDVKTYIRKESEITSSSMTDRQYEDSEESIDDDDEDEEEEEEDDGGDDDEDDGGDGDEDDDGDDADDDSVHNYGTKDDTAEESTVFDKRATLTIKDGNQWKTLGLGDLKIQYNKAKQIAQIIMLKDGSTETLCNMAINKQINVEVRKRDCEWTGMDSCLEPGMSKTLCAKFSSETAAHEFADIVSQYKEVEKSGHE